MIIPIIIAGLSLFVLERAIPDQKLPHVKGWWVRVVIVNAIQLGIVLLGAVTWDIFFQSYRLMDLRDLPPFLGGVIGYFCLTFLFYWWHRWRHEFNALWLLFHQMHHSPRRIETITSFYKHPFEIVVNALIVGGVNYIFLGLSVTAASWCILFSSLAEYFYHMNIATPRWVGYFLQRPEMHRIHHQRGKHYQNFADLPIWDMMFGTYVNPKTYQGMCGFKPVREQKFWSIFCCRNVNNFY